MTTAAGVRPSPAAAKSARTAALGITPDSLRFTPLRPGTGALRRHRRLSPSTILFADNLPMYQEMQREKSCGLPIWKFAR